MFRKKNPPLNSFSRLAVAVLFLIGGVRVGLYVRAELLPVPDENVQAEQSIESCKAALGDGEIAAQRDAVENNNTAVQTPDIDRERPGRCETWFEMSKLVAEDIYVWSTALWIVGLLLGIATLSAAVGVLTRNPNVGRYMFLVFVVQLTAAGGEIGKSVLESAQNRAIYLEIWPGLDTVQFGWFLYGGETLVKAVIYTFVCLVYLLSALMLRSKKLYGSPLSPPAAE